MDIADYSIQELVLNTFLGFVIIIALFRIAIWSLDNVVGRVFWKIIAFIKNIPNRLFRNGVKK